ncbi:unnamed protein product [Phytophthora fragariaefolia]|uniref:Unnamed protein product n=1 Tax=Phytophthora fragariaefolia TaxID=1490495 RepID=A0A9W6X7Z5_9STRA|nr:unnamed protein product [Phytophthora fragariaefolia]
MKNFNQVHVASIQCDHTFGSSAERTPKLNLHDRLPCNRIRHSVITNALLLALAAQAASDGLQGLGTGLSPALRDPCSERVAAHSESGCRLECLAPAFGLAMMPGCRCSCACAFDHLRLSRQTSRPSMDKKAKSDRSTKTSPRLQDATTPGCDQIKLRADLSTYMDVSGQLRAKRSEMYEADRRGTLKDCAALELSVEVANLKRSSDKLRLAICEQLRAFVEEIRRHLAAPPERGAAGGGDCNEAKYSVELADKCVELLHAVTITAVKEDIFEARRLLHNLRLHNGRSAVAHAPQRLQDARGDGLDDVREKLQRLIKFHDVVGYEMRRDQSGRGHSRDSLGESLEASQRLVACLRVLAEAAETIESDDALGAAAADGAPLGLEGECASHSEGTEKAFYITRQALRLFDDMMVIYLDMKAQRDLMTRAGFFLLALAVYAFLR